MMSDTAANHERQNVGRIDHIVFAYHNRENQLNAQKQFSDLLKIDDWDDLGEIEEGGVRVIISWKSGLELLCRTKEESILKDHLANHGEGFYSLVFGVADLDDAVNHIKTQGANAYYLPRPPEGVFKHMEITREAVVGEVGAINLILGEFKPINP